MLKFAYYPIRPGRQQGESLIGFIYRHYGTNGHRIPNEIYVATSAVYRSGDAAESRLAWGKLIRLMGIDPKQDQDIWFQQVLGVYVDSLTKHRWLRPRVSRMQVCPECLKLFGYYLAIWDLPLVQVCPVHRSMLLDKCECGRLLEWRQVEPGWFCRCGEAFITLTMKPAGKSHLYLTQALLATDGLPLPTGFPVENIAVYKYQNLASCYKLIRVLGS